MKLVELMVGIDQSKNSDFKLDEQGVLRFCNRICIPDDAEMKKVILEESHRSKVSIHPGATKMYQDLKGLFWWPGVVPQNFPSHLSRFFSQDSLDSRQD